MKETPALVCCIRKPRIRLVGQNNYVNFYPRSSIVIIMRLHGGLAVSTISAIIFVSIDFLMMMFVLTMVPFMDSLSAFSIYLSSFILSFNSMKSWLNMY